MKGDAPWPHAPRHQLSESGTYFLTAGTYRKQHFFRGRQRLEVLHRGLLRVARDHGWQLEAWAIFSNHYHFVGHSPVEEITAFNLSTMLNQLHENMAIWVNRLDGTPGRRVWFNYRETRLTFEKSYLARLNYVHQNPVKHGLVTAANQYSWCSAGWFERTASPSQVRTIYGFKTNAVRVYDEYDVSDDW